MGKREGRKRHHTAVIQFTKLLFPIQIQNIIMSCKAWKKLFSSKGYQQVEVCSFLQLFPLHSTINLWLSFPITYMAAKSALTPPKAEGSLHTPLSLPSCQCCPRGSFPTGHRMEEVVLGMDMQAQAPQPQCPRLPPACLKEPWPFTLLPERLLATGWIMHLGWH